VIASGEEKREGRKILFSFQKTNTEGRNDIEEELLYIG